MSLSRLLQYWTGQRLKQVRISTLPLLLFCSLSVNAQLVSDKPDVLTGNTAADINVSLTDSVAGPAFIVPDSLVPSPAAPLTTDSIGFRVMPGTTTTEVPVKIFIDEEYTHSPHKATVYAAVLPGAGQIYNKKYWKLPILYGGIGALVYAINFNTSYYDKYRSAYRDFLIRDPGNTSYDQFIPPGLEIEDVHGPYSDWFKRALQNKKRYYKRSRDLSYIGMAALYVISIIDANVDAHFYDFDISDDLSMRIEPAMVQPVGQTSSSLGLQVKFTF